MDNNTWAHLVAGDVNNQWRRCAVESQPCTAVSHQSSFLRSSTSLYTKVLIWSSFTADNTVDVLMVVGVNSKLHVRGKCQLLSCAGRTAAVYSCLHFSLYSVQYVPGILNECPRTIYITCIRTVSSHWEPHVETYMNRTTKESPYCLNAPDSSSSPNRCDRRLASKSKLFGKRTVDILVWRANSRRKVPVSRNIISAYKH